MQGPQQLAPLCPERWNGAGEMRRTMRACSELAVLREWSSQVELAYRVHQIHARSVLMDSGLTKDGIL